MAPSQVEEVWSRLEVPEKQYVVFETQLLRVLSLCAQWEMLLLLLSLHLLQMLLLRKSCDANRLKEET
jgi:hypothetical protein